MNPRKVTLVSVETPDRIPKILKNAEGFPGLVFNGVLKGLRDKVITGNLQFEPEVGTSLMLQCPPRDCGAVRTVQTSIIQEIEKHEGYMILRTQSGSIYALLEGDLV